MLRLLTHTLCCALFSAALLGAAGAPEAQARSLVANEQRSQLTARQAAQRAKAQYGGKVIKVRKQGNNFKVRLLQKSGRVITVTIRG